MGVLPDELDAADLRVSKKGVDEARGRFDDSFVRRGRVLHAKSDGAAIDIGGDGAFGMRRAVIGKETRLARGLRLAWNDRWY